MLPRSPRHDKASKYARSGLFKDLGSFAELEGRIAQLSPAMVAGLDEHLWSMEEVVMMADTNSEGETK